MRSAASGMQSQQKNVDTIANNIANVNTSGFKRNRLNFRSLLYATLREPGAATTASQLNPTGLQIGSLIAFAIITETVFQWPGMGLLFLQAIQFVDIPVMAAYLCLVAFIFVVINLIVDLLYYAIDPRLRLESGGHVE